MWFIYIHIPGRILCSLKNQCDSDKCCNVNESGGHCGKWA